MSPTSPCKVFISYATEDADKAGQLSYSLSWLGFKTFLAHENISKGELWRDAIDNNLKGADVFLPLLTDEALTSAWVNQESGIAHFLKRKKRNKFAIIPLVQGKQVPPGCLSVYQALSLKVGFFGLGRVTIQNEIVRKIGVEIVNALNASEVTKTQAMANIKKSEFENTRHIIEFIYTLENLGFQDFLSLINHDIATGYIYHSDSSMKRMYGWIKHFETEIEKYPDWVKAWNQLSARYKKRKEEERRRAQEQMDALVKMAEQASKRNQSEKTSSTKTSEPSGESLETNKTP